MPCTVRPMCMRNMAVWYRSWPPGIISASCCPCCAVCCVKRTSQPASIDGIAYTAGPGLIGALLVGAAVARSLAWSWGIPAVAVHHMEGHLLAPMLEPEPPGFPFVALLVSGGHTQLVEVTAVGRYRMLGESVDDAAGEAFDKTAKLLGLPYPGGPELARRAESGDPNRYHFPRPMTDRPGLDFSFSGLKTFALNTLQAAQQQAGGEISAQTLADIARAFEDAVVDTLLIKCRRAVRETGMPYPGAGGRGQRQPSPAGTDRPDDGEGGRQSPTIPGCSFAPITGP